MAKTEADGLKKITTSFLKKEGYFYRSMCGVITWTFRSSDNKHSIGAQSSIENDSGTLRIYYTQTDNSSGEKKDFDYKIPLTSSPCRYGGRRYWFICPWYKNGVYCGRRIGVLYKDGDYFACRHCYNLTYSSRNLSGISKHFGNITAPDLDEMREKIKRTHYKGKITKKYRRYLQAEKRFENAFIFMAGILNKKVRSVRDLADK